MSTGTPASGATQGPPPLGLRRTPLYDKHVALGAKMVPFAGWEMPIQYAGIISEHRAVRGAVGLFDLSHMGEFFFEGSGAQAFIDGLVSSDIGGLDVGHARYGLLTNERGTIVDDVIVYRIAPQRLMVVVNASNIEKDAAHVRAHVPAGVRFDDRSMQTALIAPQGPRAATIVSRVAGMNLDDLLPFGVAETTVGGAKATVARTGYTGEDGFEVFVANEDAERVWDALSEAGKDDGLQPIGLGARDTLRLEARFSLYGNEIDETTNPIEAGLAWTCKLDKEFLGRDEIVKVKERGPQRRIAGLLVNGGVARHGHPATSDGKVVGVVTSGTFGPTVEKNIALAYLPAALAKVGTEVGVRIREKDVPATVVKTPFYKRSEK